MGYIISANALIGHLVFRTREALNNDKSFMDGLMSYQYAQNCLTDGKFNLWHYPGTHNEISELLQGLDQHINGGKVKFPSVLNFQPINQYVEGPKTFMTFNLAFIARTTLEWNTPEREKYLFEPVLRPIVASFMDVLSKSGRLFRLSYNNISYDYFENFTTGNNQGSIKDKYGDFIDAIELHNLRLELNPLCQKDIILVNRENLLVTSKLIETLNA